MSVLPILYHPVSGKTNNLLLFVVALVPAIVLFPFPVSVFSNGIDPPLAWVFNFLIQGNLELGKQIIFPHGPLAFLMYPLPVGSNLWIAVSVHLVARIFLAYSILKLATRKPIAYMLLALVSSFILLAINDLLLTIVQIIVLCYLNFFERRNITWLIPAMIITALALYIKAFVGITSLIISLSFAGIMLHRAIVGLESWYRLLLFLIIPFVLLMAWLGMYGDFNGLAAYLDGMMELAADNSAAVAVYPLNNWWFIGIALLSGLILIIINLKNSALVRFTILLGPALFAIWKYGMAREDYLHTSMLFVILVSTLLVYTIIAGKFRIINSLLSVVIVLLFYFTLQNSYYYEPFHLRVNGIQNLVVKAFNNKYFVDTCNRSTEKLIARNKLDQQILDLIGNQTVDIYPWDYSYIAANNLNWQPRPVLQSYASYTRKLDQLNARHFESEKAPEFILWELRKISHDIHNGTLESIDGRYLLNDEPETMLALLRNYELAATQKGIFPVLVYRKKAEPLKQDVKLISQTKASWNTWITVPAHSPDILSAEVSMNRSLYGNFKSFLYKDEATYVYNMLQNGDIRMYRIVPKNAAYGLWVNPLILNPGRNRKESEVIKIMFRCSNTAMMKDEIEIRWKQVTFSETNTSTGKSSPSPNTANAFFGISGLPVQTELLVSLNNLEKNVKYWSIPNEINRVFTAGNHAFQLLPEGYSVSFEYPLDSLNMPFDSAGLMIRSGLWAKAALQSRAVYVISIEKDGKSLLWKAADIQGFLHDEHEMNFVTNFAILDKELLSQKGLMLNVYAWNTGKEPLLLDDFSVRIEKK